MKPCKTQSIKRFITVFSLTLILIAGTISLSAIGSSGSQFPRIGSIYKLDGTDYIVRGAGNTPFQYKATGESLVIKIDGIPGTMTLVPKRGEIVRVDPTIPMIWVGGTEKTEMRRNAYLQKHGKNAVFLLLELKR